MNVNLVEENPIIVLDENGGNDPENPELSSTSPETRQSAFLWPNLPHLLHLPLNLVLKGF